MHKGRKTQNLWDILHSRSLSCFSLYLGVLGTYDSTVEEKQGLPEAKQGLPKGSQTCPCPLLSSLTSKDACSSPRRRPLFSAVWITGATCSFMATTPLLEPLDWGVSHNPVAIVGFRCPQKSGREGNCQSTAAAL